MSKDSGSIAQPRTAKKLGHFATQSEANNWIALQFTSYFLRANIKNDQGLDQQSD
jgi:hypothetical protein